MHFLLNFKNAFLLIITTISICEAQSIPQIDNLLEETRELLIRAELDKVINNSYDIIAKSKKISYKRGIVDGYQNIAEALLISGQYDKSLEYLQKLKPFESYLETVHSAQFTSHLLKARNYHFLKLQTLASQYYLGAYNAILKESVSEDKALGLLILYSYVRVYSDHPDTIYKYLCKLRDGINTFNYKGKSTSFVADNALVCVNIGDHFLSTNTNLDSAQHYYNNAVQLINKQQPHYFEAYAYNGLSLIAEKNADFKKALEYRKLSIEIAKRHQLFELLKDAYEHAIQIYTQLGDTALAQEYRALYTNISDSLTLNQVKGREKVILDIIDSQEDKLRKAKSKVWIIIAVVFSSLALIFSFILIWIRRLKEQKKADLIQKEISLNQLKEELILKSLELKRLNQKIDDAFKELDEKEKETQKLVQKVNDSFDELILLAKSNHPNFYTRFKELYPELHHKLVDINPELRISELTLCAYIYLDFSAKEIAKFTFKSSRTIQTRKSDLRKKLGIVSEIDLHVWMKDLQSD